jgi:hypothetical protein
MIKDTINRIFNKYSIFDDATRYQIVFDQILEMYNGMSEEDKDKLRLFLFDNGIRHLAGIE